MKRHQADTDILCHLCKDREQYELGEFVCPAFRIQQIDDITLKWLMKETPFSQWWTPNDLGAEFNYSTKHIIRLVQNPHNNIAAVNVDGRWFVLKCSFEAYLERVGKR